MYLKDILRLFASKHPGLKFQQDNTRLNNGNISTNCFRAYLTVSWSVRYPDLELNTFEDLTPSQYHGNFNQHSERAAQEILHYDINQLYVLISIHIMATEKGQKWSTPYLFFQYLYLYLLNKLFNSFDI